MVTWHKHAKIVLHLSLFCYYEYEKSMLIRLACNWVDMIDNFNLAISRIRNDERFK